MPYISLDVYGCLGLGFRALGAFFSGLDICSRYALLQCQLFHVDHILICNIKRSACRGLCTIATGRYRGGCTARRRM